MDEASSTGDLSAALPAGPRRAAMPAPAARIYLVLFTPRSGSTWLTSVLSATGRLGHPQEFLNPGLLPGVAQSLGTQDPAKLIERLLRQRKTANGVFGLEARASDIESFGEPILARRLGRHATLFFLWRDNIVAQGISLYRAIATKRFHSTDPDVPPPPYDAGHIETCIRHAVSVEDGNLRLLHRWGRWARFLRYEDLVRDRATAVAVFADALRVHIPPRLAASPVARELRKIGDDWNGDAEERFRAECRDIVDAVERARLIKADPAAAGSAQS